MTFSGARNATLQATRFADRDAAKEWIIRNQLGRRNLTDAQRVQLALRLKPVAQAKAKERQIRKPDSVSQIFDEQTRADEEIAKAAGVSRGTVRKVEHVNAKATPELRAAMNSNAVTINTAAKVSGSQEIRGTGKVPQISEEPFFESVGSSNIEGRFVRFLTKLQGRQISSYPSSEIRGRCDRILFPRILGNNHSPQYLGK